MLTIGRQQPALLRRVLEQVLAEAEAGRLKALVSHVLPATRIADAHRLMQSRQSIGKIVMTW